MDSGAHADEATAPAVPLPCEMDATGPDAPVRHSSTSHICTGTGPTPATSAPGLGPPLPDLHRNWAVLCAHAIEGYIRDAVGLAWHEGTRVCCKLHLVCCTALSYACAHVLCRLRCVQPRLDETCRMQGDPAENPDREMLLMEWVEALIRL